jgi:predicted heme/steroid binding protein
MKDFTKQQLAQHDGSNPDLPMLISIRGVVFDVSTGKQFYGPNGESSSGIRQRAGARHSSWRQRVDRKLPASALQAAVVSSAHSLPLVCVL